MVALVCGRGAGVPLSSVPVLCEQPVATMAPVKTATPKSFFIWLLSSHKKHGSATAICRRFSQGGARGIFHWSNKPMFGFEITAGRGQFDGAPFRITLALEAAFQKLDEECEFVARFDPQEFARDG